MKNYLRPVVPPVLLVFAGCAAEYSKTEAPAQLRVDSAGSPFEGAFTGGSDCLTRSESAKLDRMVLAGCAAEYSKTEAPAQLRVDGAGSRFEVAFAGGSDHLTPKEAAKLDRMVLTGNIPLPALAAQRRPAVVSRQQVPSRAARPPAPAR